MSLIGNPLRAFGIKCQFWRSSSLSLNEAFAACSGFRLPRNFVAASAISSTATCATAAVVKNDNAIRETRAFIRQRIEGRMPGTQAGSASHRQGVRSLAKLRAVNILFIGDIVGEPGRKAVKQLLPG